MKHFRRNTYDGAPIAINSILNLNDTLHSRIFKSGDRDAYWEQQKETINQIILLTNLVAKQYQDLKDDYSKGAINRAKYLDNLKQFQRVIDVDMVKNNLMKVCDIVQEVKKQLE